METSGNIAVVVCQFKGHVLVFDVDPENGKLYQKQAKIKNIWFRFYIEIKINFTAFL